MKEEKTKEAYALVCTSTAAALLRCSEVRLSTVLTRTGVARLVQADIVDGLKEQKEEAQTTLRKYIK